MLNLIQTLLAKLVDSPAALRAALGILIGWIETYATSTSTKVDDVLAKVLRTIIESDDLWEQVSPLLPLLFGVRVNPDVPIEENHEVQAVAKQVGAAAGISEEAALSALCGMAK